MGTRALPKGRATANRASTALIRCLAVKFCPHCSAFLSNDATYCPEDGTALKRTHDPYLGRTIAARYHLVKRLGSGGMSNVYLAHHVMIQRLSALKILREDLSRQPTHRERFLREARAVNRINHPNIVEISDLGEADGVAYLVMEFVDGPSLHQEIGKGVMPWQRAVRIGLQVAAALARAHQMSVVHRDLKPENVLLAKHLRDVTELTPYPLPPHAEHDLVKLTDFGIAKILDEPGLTVGEQLFGTPGYIAPEYLEGTTADPRSDLYSLGVILYEMTTGALPYDARGAALLTAPMRELPVAPSRRVPAYFADLEDLIMRLLARSPEDRPADAFAVYDALTRLLRAEVRESSPVLSTTPQNTRISYAAQRGVRQDAVTLAETGSGVALSSLYAQKTSDLALAAAAGTVRWHEAVAELEAGIAVAQRQKFSIDRIDHAIELAALARGKLYSLERVSHAVSGHQERVDDLEAQGRAFRGDIGRAIDQLVLDRSRERAHCEAVALRLASLRLDPKPEPSSDASLWETAALSAEGGTSEVAEVDLTFQIEALQTSLFAKNLALEGDLTEASGALEGSLAAVRHLTHELQRLLDEAGDVLAIPRPGRPAELGPDGVPESMPETHHVPQSPRDARPSAASNGNRSDAPSPLPIGDSAPPPRWRR